MLPSLEESLAKKPTNIITNIYSWWQFIYPTIIKAYVNRGYTSNGISFLPFIHIQFSALHDPTLSKIWLSHGKSLHIVIQVYGKPCQGWQVILPLPLFCCPDSQISLRLDRSYLSKSSYNVQSRWKFMTMSPVFKTV